MKFPYTLKRRSIWNQYKRYEQSYRALELLRSSPLEGPGGGGVAKFLSAYDQAHSERLQEIFALLNNSFQKDGFFVEFGALDGITLSNTWLLETDYNWQGILAEPAKFCHEALKQNRNCHIDTRCIWRESGERILFNEHTSTGLSGIAATLARPARRVSNKQRTYHVETLSLNDLLSAYSAPSYINYISIDTEGSEFEILNAFDFNRHRFGCLSIEHNFCAQRERIYALLTSHGYRRVCEEISGVDDWYVA